MKKLLYSLLVTVVLISCGKRNEYSTNFSSVAFINASPGAPAVNVFIDTIEQTAGAVAYRSTSGYRSVEPGMRNIEFRTTVNFVTAKRGGINESFTVNTASSIFLYDTLTAANQTFRTLRLSDDLTLPANGMIKVRFVPLAMNAPAVDVTFLRTSAATPDSVTITNRTYVGANPSDATKQTLSNFQTIPLGAYTIKLKAAGTQNVLASGAFNLNGITGTTGIYTIYSVGTAQREPLAISSFRHFPQPQ